jgi:hypothetical protein
MSRRFLPLFVLLSLALAPTVATAASEAVQIRLSGSSGRTSYKVPVGKVLLVEHIDFCDYWVSQPDNLEVWLQHSTNPVGTVWSSKLRYFSAHNYLPRVLRVPANSGIAMPYFGSSSFKAFIYGVLVDAPSQIITQ